MSLSGVLSAVATPLDADQQIDEARLRTLVGDTIEAGVHGLVPGGSTGEFAFLSNSERRQVLETVIEETDGRLPVVGNAGALSTVEAVDLAQHAERAGAAAIIAVAPFYIHLSLGETKDFYRRIADAVSVPIVIYNLPLATGINLTPEDLREIATVAENVQYVKDTSGDYHQLTRLVHEHSDVITTLIGWDTMLMAGFIEGAAGTINGAANFMARPLVALWDAVQREDLVAARREWAGVYPLLRFLLGGSYVAGVKAVMTESGTSIGPPRAPTGELDESRLRELRTILAPTEPQLVGHPAA